MVKSIISIIVVSILITFGAVFESFYTKSQFEKFNLSLTTLYQKIEDELATEDDVLSVQNQWIKQKKNLCVFVPHTEVKEIELWLSETVSLVKDKNYKDAISKVEVLIELSEQIPKSFNVSIETVF